MRTILIRWILRGVGIWLLLFYVFFPEPGVFLWALVPFMSGLPPFSILLVLVPFVAALFCFAISMQRFFNLTRGLITLVAAVGTYALCWKGFAHLVTLVAKVLPK